MKCGHHRQRAGGEVLPCAHPSCDESIPTACLMVNSTSGPLYFERHRSEQRLSGGVVRAHYCWREAPLPNQEAM